MNVDSELIETIYIFIFLFSFFGIVFYGFIWIVYNYIFKNIFDLAFTFDEEEKKIKNNKKEYEFFSS